MPRRDGFSSEGYERTDLSDWYSFSWGGPCSPGRPCKKVHGAVVICTMWWPQHSPDLGSTSASKASISAQLGPISSNFGLTWLQDGATWPELGPIWEQIRPKLRSTWLQIGGHDRPNPKSSTHPFSPVCSRFFAIDNALFEAMFPMLCLRWAELGVKLSPKLPSYGMLELTRTSMCITWFAWGPTSAQHDQLAPTRNLGPSCLRAARPSQFCGFNATCWAQVGPKLEPTGPSSAQVKPSWAQMRSCSSQLKGPRTARLDPSRLWLGQVRLLLSSLPNSLGAGGSRREATRIFLKNTNTIHIYMCVCVCVILLTNVYCICTSLKK